MNFRPFLVIFISCSVKWFHGAKVDIPCGRRLIPKSVQSDNGTVLNRYRRIVDGDISYYGQWPWIVSLKNPILKNLIQRHTPKYMNWSLVGMDNHICGGTLINNQWIVTAKHCLYYNFSPQSTSVTSNWSATMGAFNISGESIHSVNIPVDKVVYHEGWFGNPSLDLDDNDFAMMHLIRPVNFTDYIYPACLPNNSLVIPGKVCHAVGWGTAYSLNDTLVNPVLKHATLKIMARQESKACITQTSKEICTSPLSGSVCRGDSGGPLLCPGQNDEWVFVGVTVRGSGCQKKTDRSIFTSVYHHLDFVLKTINCSIMRTQQFSHFVQCLILIFVIFLVFLL